MVSRNVDILYYDDCIKSTEYNSLPCVQCKVLIQPGQLEGVVVAVCGHVMHQHCYLNSYSELPNAKCPICAQSLTKDAIVIYAKKRFNSKLRD